MPSTTLFLKFGENNPIRVFKKKIANALVVEDPTIVGVLDGKIARETRTATTIHYEQIGTGKTLTAEIILKDPEGQIVPSAQARLIVDHIKNLVLNDKSEDVDKTKIVDHILNPDGSIGEETEPFISTDMIEIGDEDWIPATAIEEFLITEVYELPAADSRNDAKLFEYAEKATKNDEIIIKTYSNGGYTQYYCFLMPVFKEGKFVWVIKLSKKKIECRLLRDIPAPTTALIKEVKSAHALPPIQAVITVQKKKEQKQDSA